MTADAVERESMEFDVVIVGAARGPQPLSAENQLAAETGKRFPLSFSKGSEVGGHILSGAVIDPGR
jgi:electron-transferring-flavoprotein dehydrogenase